MSAHGWWPNRYRKQQKTQDFKSKKCITNPFLRALLQDVLIAKSPVVRKISLGYVLERFPRNFFGAGRASYKFWYFLRGWALRIFSESSSRLGLVHVAGTFFRGGPISADYLFTLRTTGHASQRLGRGLRRPGERSFQRS